VSDTGPAAVDSQALMALGEALDRLWRRQCPCCVEVGLLARAFPQWAVWRQADGLWWIAVRPAGSMPPGPEAPTVWVRAGTAAGLAGRMRAADTGLSPGWGL
jgi:hypothetical protein